MTTTVNPQDLSYDQLKAAVAKAIQDGRDADMIMYMGLINKHKADVAKAENEKAAKELVELTKKRDELLKVVSDDLYATFRSKYQKQFQALKVNGLTISVSRKENERQHWDENGTVIIYGGIALNIPVVKAARKVGGGGTGTKRDLQAEFNAVANPDEQAELAAIDNQAVCDGATPVQGTTLTLKQRNGQAWNYKNKVVKKHAK